MSEQIDLDKLRAEIDAINKRMLADFETRMDTVVKVAEYKRQHNLAVFDAARERRIIAAASAGLKNPALAPYVTEFMENLMRVSRKYQEQLLEKPTGSESSQTMQVGCFGEQGSFTHEALERYFAGHTLERHFYSLFEDVIKAVKKGEISYGVLPIENSSTGGITEVYDLLRKYDCHIVGEKCIKIEQNLLGVPGARLEDIKTVYSHPQGFAQSRDFFAEYPQMELVPYYNTSKSAELVGSKQDKALAAVAARSAAALYGLEIVAANINYNGNNFTRFVVIANEAEHSSDADKITVVFAVKHEPGSLYRTLGHFYHSGLNLTNLESRPIEGKSWEYFFHIDLRGNLAERRVQETMQQLQESCAYCKILGNYRADTDEEQG